MTGNRLRQLRLESGMVQAELAVRAGVSPATVGAIERYGYPPSPQVRRKLAKALRLDVRDIWPREEEPVAS